MQAKFPFIKAVILVSVAGLPSWAGFKATEPSTAVLNPDSAVGLSSGLDSAGLSKLSNDFANMGAEQSQKDGYQKHLESMEENKKAGELEKQAAEKLEEIKAAEPEEVAKLKAEQQRLISDAEERRKRAKQLTFESVEKNLQSEAQLKAAGFNDHRASTLMSEDPIRSLENRTLEQITGSSPDTRTDSPDPWWVSPRAKSETYIPNYSSASGSSSSTDDDHGHSGFSSGTSPFSSSFSSPSSSGGTTTQIVQLSSSSTSPSASASQAAASQSTASSNQGGSSESSARPMVMPSAPPPPPPPPPAAAAPPPPPPPPPAPAAASTTEAAATTQKAVESPSENVSIQELLKAKLAEITSGIKDPAPKISEPTSPAKATTVAKPAAIIGPAEEKAATATPQFASASTPPASSPIADSHTRSASKNSTGPLATALNSGATLYNPVQTPTTEGAAAPTSKADMLAILMQSRSSSRGVAGNSAGMNPAGVESSFSGTLNQPSLEGADAISDEELAALISGGVVPEGTTAAAAAELGLGSRRGVSSVSRRRIDRLTDPNAPVLGGALEVVVRQNTFARGSSRPK